MNGTDFHQLQKDIKGIVHTMYFFVTPYDDAIQSAQSDRILGKKDGMKSTVTIMLHCGARPGEADFDMFEDENPYQNNKQAIVVYYNNTHAVPVTITYDMIRGHTLSDNHARFIWEYLISQGWERAKLVNP